MSSEEEDLLRSVALQNARVVLHARQRAERELLEAKEALRETAERLQVALSAGHLGYWSWDAASDTVTLSADAARIFALPGLERVPQAQLHALVHQDDRVRERAASRIALAHHGDYDVEYRLLAPGGDERWVAVKGRGAYDASGAALGMSGVVQDLTERKRVDHALRESEEWLRATFHQAAIGFAVATLDGRFVELNRKFCEILGFTEEELRGRTFVDITHPDDVAETRLRVAALLAGEVDDVTYEKRYVRRDGGVVWSLTTVTLLKDRSGGARSFIGVIEDITQRKEAEEALHEETRVLEILNRTGAAIGSELDLLALLQTVTDAATALTGAKFGAFFYTVVSETGESLSLYTLSGASRAAFDRFGLPRNTPVFGPTFRDEGVVRSADILADPRYGHFAPHHGMPEGHPAVRSYLAVSVVSRSREVIGGLFFGHPDPGVFTERSERLVVGMASQAAIAIDNANLYEAAQKASAERQRLLESERYAREQAERMSELKDHFLATLSHELRTPLGAILGWAGVVRTRKLEGGELQHAIEVIERNARSQARLVDDLLDMARIRAGQLRLELQPTDLAGVVAEALDTLRPAAEGRGILVETRIDPDVVPLWGDPGRLQQVVWNLLSNAIKFTPKSGVVRIVLALHGSHLELSVADTGPGIPAEFLPFVFDRFRQADASSTRAHGGLGLGLAIVKHLVELHGGSVRVESAGAERGTTFTVLLPVGDIPREADVSVKLRASSVPVPSVLLPDLTGLTVLAVDDQPEAHRLTRAILT
nr:PAS domain S-box protein [Deltaproteobacteria bacterium]